jgi:hypothetical protein
LACWFWKRGLLKNFSVFLFFRYYLPLEKGYSIHWSKLESLHLTMIFVKCGQNWSSGSGEEFESKSLQTEGGQRAIRNAHFRFQLW